ncbi:MAG: hypothetical protein ACP5VS_09530 [Desulfomonilaceae bacterium]
MKSRICLPTSVLLFTLFVIVCLSLAPTPSHSQWMPAWLSNGRFWDWSDYRFTVRTRYFFPRLVSGTFSRSVWTPSTGFTNQEFDLLGAPAPFNPAGPQTGGYNFNAEPLPVGSVLFQWQIDRLGLRLVSEENYIFQGVIGSVVFAGEAITNGPSIGAVNTVQYWGPGNAQDFVRGSKLNVSATRWGFSLDLLRNPFLRAGIDVDYYINPVTFNDSKQGYVVNPVPAYYDPNYNLPTDPPGYQGIAVYALAGNEFYGSGNPLTVGLHMLAMPGRIREIPIIFQTKIDFPMPFMKLIFNVANPANIFQWEASIGARPAVWDASFIGLSTFSLAIEGGFRYVDLNANFFGTNLSATYPWTSSPSASLKARWDGFFIQIGVYY